MRTLGIQSQNEQNKVDTGKNISFDTVSNLYLSAMATQQASANAASANAGSGYPDLSVIAGLYSAAAGDDGVINSETELQNVLNAIESVTKIDLFEFDESGKNIGKNEHSTEAGATAATEKKGIDENGVLVAKSCPLDPKREKPCTCKVTDGFASITDLFDKLANDTDAGVIADEFTDEEETALFGDYKSKVGMDLNFGLTAEDNKLVTEDEKKALELLNKNKSAQDIANLPVVQQTIIKDYLGALSPEVRDAKLIAVYGSIEAAKTALGDLIPTDTSSSMMNPQKTGTHAINNRNSNDTTQ